MTVSSRSITLLVLLLSTFLGACASVGGLPDSGAQNQTPTLGVRLRVTPAESIRGAARLSNAEVLRVVGVKPNQSAEAAGIRVGDVLLEINGVAVRGMADSIAILQDSRWGDTLSAAVMRDNRILIIPVSLKRQRNAAPTKQYDETSIVVAGLATHGAQSSTSDTQTSISRPIIVESTSAKNFAVVVVDRANVRANASTDSKIVKSLQRGAEVMVTDIAGNWSAIVTQNGNGISGFMHSSLLAK